MATIPLPATWVSGTVPAAGGITLGFNDNIRDPINFFKIPPRVAAKHSSPITRTNRTTWTVIPWDTDVDDTDAMHDPVTNNSWLISKTAGWYHVWCNIVWEEHSVEAYDGARSIQIRKNSGGSNSGGTVVGFDIRHSNSNPLEAYGASAQYCEGYAQLSVGDYVQAFAFDNDDDKTVPVVGSPCGCTLDPSTYSSARFGMCWVGII